MLETVGLDYCTQTFCTKTIDSLKIINYNKFTNNKLGGEKMKSNILITNTDELRKARELKGFSHRDMSKFLGAKSSATYYNIETGKVEPKIGQALRISKLLKEPVTNFFKLKV